MMVAAFSGGAAASWAWLRFQPAPGNEIRAVAPPAPRRKTYWVRNRLARLKAAVKFLLRRSFGQDFVAINLEELEWARSSKSGSLIKKVLDDPETGMAIRVLRYPAGILTPKHIHPCSHGLYVLEGVLQTDRGRFPPGTFVWFPEGEAAEHGASAEGDALVLLMSNKPFTLDYV